MKIFIIIAYLILLSLNIYDGYSTAILMNNGYVEANPFMNYMMDQFGIIPALVMFKGIGFLILFFICIKYIKKEMLSLRDKVIIFMTFLILIGAYTFVLFNLNYQFMSTLS